MPRSIDLRTSDGVAVLACRTSLVGQTLDQAQIAHRVLLVQDAPILLPAFRPPAVLDTTSMQPLHLAHVLFQLARTHQFPVVALASPQSGAALRLLACSPAIAAVMGLYPNPQMFAALFRFVQTLHPGDRSGPVWYEVPPFTFDPRLDLNGLLVALDGAHSLAHVEQRLACSRSAVRRRLAAAAAVLGVADTHKETPQAWLNALVASLGRPVCIG